MSELELALLALGRELDWPSEPNLEPAVRRRLVAAPARRRLPARRTLAFAAAVLAVAVGAVMAVPQTRAAVLDLFGLRGVSIERVETLPPVPKAAPRLLLGERISLDEARERVDFDVVVPDALGEPDEVWWQGSPPGGMVSFVYGSSTEPRALVTEFRGTVREVVFKKAAAGTRIEPVEVDGQPGYWLSGEPHVFSYFDRRGEFRQELVRLAGNTLLWERGALTMRLEASISKAEALAIARSAG